MPFLLRSKRYYRWGKSLLQNETKVLQRKLLDNYYKEGPSTIKIPGLTE